jgi:hypothetical protein
LHKRIDHIFLDSIEASVQIAAPASSVQPLQTRTGRSKPALDQHGLDALIIDLAMPMMDGPAADGFDDGGSIAS